jgi:hypothetical protein
MIYHNYGVRELEVKKQVANYVKNNIPKLKSLKISKVASQEIMSDLFTIQKETSFQCMMAVILFFKINIIIIDPTGKFILEFVSDELDHPTFLIKKNTKGRYSIKVEPMGVTEIEKIKSEKLLLHNHLKPIKSASAYKVHELEELARKVGIFDETINYKKIDLYNNVINTIKWS